MSKKHRIILLLITILSLFSTVAQGANDYIDKSQLNSGVIRINSNGKVGAVRVSKGSTSYDYILKGNENIPLQLGNGEYTILALESVGGNKFKQIAKETVTLNSKDSNQVYLQSIQMINWNNDMNAIKKTKELTKNTKSDKEKVEAIYNYIVANISYDKNKASNLSSNYIPKIDETLKVQTGICYDYASLFAAMTRSVGVPTKLIMGHKDDVEEYHAWNQVYLEETKEWLTIDTTYDAGKGKGNQSIPMIKDAKAYKIEKQY